MSTATVQQVSIRNSRLLAYQQLMDRMDRRSAETTPVWTEYLERLPLTLGESSMERVAPCSVSDNLLQAMAKGVDGLVDLLKRRAEPAYDREKNAALLPDEHQRVVLWPKRFCPRTIPVESSFRPLIGLAQLQCPELDGGLMESWLTKQAGGRLMFESLHQVLSKSLRLSRENPSCSGAMLLSCFALIKTLQETKDRIKNVSIKGLPYARTERAVGQALFANFSCAVTNVLSSSHAPPTDTPEYTDLLILLVGMDPTLFLSIRGLELNEDINPYGISADLDKHLYSLYLEELERGNNTQRLLEAMIKTGLGSPVVRPLLLQEATVEYFRRLALHHLLFDEDSSLQVDQLLAAAFGQNSALRSLIEDSSKAESMAAQLQSWIDARRMHSEVSNATRTLLAFLQQIQQQGPLWGIGGSELLMVAVQDLMERFMLRALDTFARTHIENARGRIVDRRKNLATATLIREYEAGRLYRIADDEMPLVKTRLSSNEAQLFVDLKGYTRRTSRAKEMVMADFLKTEFYEPILHAAKQYYAGLNLVPGEQNIQLVNLLGDAVVFSGNIVSLVGLAYNIQRIFREYQRKLQRLIPQESGQPQDDLHQTEEQRDKRAAEIERIRMEAESIQREQFRRRSLPAADLARQLEADYQEQAESLSQQFRAAQALEKQTTDPAQRKGIATTMAQLKSAHDSLKAQRQQLGKQTKNVRDQALVRQLQDLLCRPLQEKAQRLEERAVQLKAEMQSLDEKLEQEYRVRQGSGLEAGLFISYGVRAEVITIDDEIWGHQRVAISERINEAARGTARNDSIKSLLNDLLAAHRAQRNLPHLEYPFRIFISNISKAKGEASSDIYNLGEAISEPALGAYLRQTRNTHAFFRFQISIDSLHQELQERFYLPDETLSLVCGRSMSAATQHVEVFRYAGEVMFRGFEISRPTAVYEIIRPDSSLLRLLVKHHLNDWLANMEQHPELRLAGLENPDSSEPTRNI